MRNSSPIQIIRRWAVDSKGYTAVPADLMADAGLPVEAKGLYIKLASLHPGTRVELGEEEWKMLTELEKAGWVITRPEGGMALVELLMTKTGGEKA